MKALLILLAAILFWVDAHAAAEPIGEKVSAYYYAPYQDKAAVMSTLQAAGFEIVGRYATTDKSETIVMTTEALKAAAKKPGRGFGAVLRVLVDGENQRIAVTNPVYFGKAFFQSEYDHTLGDTLTAALQKALGDLSVSEDAFEYDKLAGYHFMIGMPYYEDTYALAEGDTQALLSKLETYNDGRSVVFKLPLGEGKVLVGYALSDETKSFVKTIGAKNAEILPYTILIEEGKAQALAAKYYIAISYPLLSMGEFMQIVNTPGAIEEELSTPFK
ncbi:hypothetical protein LOH54_12565 [Sulfurimonas sp. HSL-3221]|uniref:hypothetical protein n=1 Tax=Sulfurimonadaceae TaxID=2771471 RepID=UPI001E5154F6|nr:hypothetical protein [Sulfurimonas sp. HSL-3221]UFS62467.1 hypothetical protein LOH54_12565 [Sulfurimonas sp. HSL-3221]